MTSLVARGPFFLTSTLAWSNSAAGCHALTKQAALSQDVCRLSADLAHLLSSSTLIQSESCFELCTLSIKLIQTSLGLSFANGQKLDDWQHLISWNPLLGVRLCTQNLGPAAVPQVFESRLSGKPTGFRHVLSQKICKESKLNRYTASDTLLQIHFRYTRIWFWIARLEARSKADLMRVQGARRSFSQVAEAPGGGVSSISSPWHISRLLNLKPTGWRIVGSFGSKCVTCRQWAKVKICIRLVDLSSWDHFYPTFDDFQLESVTDPQAYRHRNND